MSSRPAGARATRRFDGMRPTDMDFPEVACKGVAASQTVALHLGGWAALVRAGAQSDVARRVHLGHAAHLKRAAAGRAGGRAALGKRSAAGRARACAGHCKVSRVAHCGRIIQLFVPMRYMIQKRKGFQDSHYFRQFWTVL